MFARRILAVVGHASLFTSAGVRALCLQASKASITDAIANEKVVVFSKTYCAFSTRVKETLNMLGTQYEVVELDTRADGGEIQALLLEITGQRTVPNVFINGIHIGGSDKVMDLYNNGKLVSMLKN